MRAHCPGRLRSLLPGLVLMLLASTVGAAQTVHDHLVKAAGYLKANDPGAAAAEFKAVLAIDPKNAEANANLGVIAFLHGEYKNAAQYLRSALATDPSLVK